MKGWTATKSCVPQEHGRDKDRAPENLEGALCTQPRSVCPFPCRTVLPEGQMPGEENDLRTETGGGYDAGGHFETGLSGAGRRQRMKIRLIDFGVPENQRPFRPHGNDSGADVYMPYDCTLQPGEIAKVPLGFGIEVPDGYAGYVFPRTSMAVKGLVCELPPVDSGYRGEIHANTLLAACAEVIIIQEEYRPNVYSKRNRYMAEHADRVIAVYDGREKAVQLKPSVMCTNFGGNCGKYP